MLDAKIESMDRDAILKLQADKLAALGNRLASSPEWVAHFKKAGMSPKDIAAPDGLANAPFLEKADLRERYPFPLLTEDMSNVARFCATSGTTGLPVVFGFTQKDLQQTLAGQVARQLHCNGVRPGDRAYQGLGYGLWVGGPAYDLGLQKIGATCIPMGPGRSDLVVQWMKDQEWDFASLSPLFLATLIRVAREQGIDPKKDWKIRNAVVGGQSVSRAFRDELEAEMPDGFMTYNTYGTTEAGGPVVATACRHSHADDEMHLINEDTILTEILDPVTMKPVGPGEIGEIVVTTLEKQASPVVRWRTRDLVRVSDSPYDCACGRCGFPKIGRLIGRSDDMLKIRGVIVYPSQIEDVIASTPGAVKEAWQIYVSGDQGVLSTITVSVECEAGYDGSHDDFAAVIARNLSSRLGLKVPVECHPYGTLPRYEAKAQRVIVK